MSDGDNKSPILSANDRLKEFEKILNEYDTKIGIASIRYNEEVELCMNLTRSQINAMTIQECAAFCLILAQYSTFLQLEYNRNRVRNEWATRELDLIIASDASKYGYGDPKNFVKYEFVRSKIILANAGAKALAGIIKHASARATELDQISTKVSMVSKALNDVKMVKVKE